MSTVERHSPRLVTDGRAGPLLRDAPGRCENIDLGASVTPHPALVRLANIHCDAERSFRRVAVDNASTQQLGRAVDALTLWRSTARRTFAGVALLSIFANVLILTVLIYLFQLSDNIIPSRGIDPLLISPGLTLGVLAAISMLDLLRRRMLGRLGALMEAVLGGAILSAILMSPPTCEGSYVQALRSLHKVCGFLSSPTMLHLFDVPLTPFFFPVVFLINPRLGAIVLIAGLVVLGAALFKRMNASWIVRTLSLVAVIGWGVHLMLAGTLTAGMMIAASIIAGRALQPLEGVIEGLESLIQTQATYMRVRASLEGRQSPNTDGVLHPAPIPVATGTTNVRTIGNSAVKWRHIAMSC